ncbi:molecular chaperone DnaJ [Aetokthonos hydrillicola Thurmond2011]|jgi:curved DNA-binding protein CbpA|uniref:Molecular chaperone DnaJ n=1 Tax=Aetokthonos hydrillicola Thurmond2011 TaxID=2712845 RepID=A0AAP5MB79_9CYAN|nr:DnaJ domain-containing protein [Aetokthonos hydrillicola]MBO3460444.1 molecular chaperone DnaJ [Aetokthonos hydrillicola CCALA 1050]MBW4588479.1 molecular chaperone DnaJ [Aetokthonos hydrillicola CCALA 1050]MDR9896808.1 molecular chaperone DnaJ [Aetokthonos hydrillicola Thurmond2011]
MLSNYERLGISPGATPAEIKAAYHAKLREFPAHTYPQEFKEIRAAYEALRKGETNQYEDFLKTRPLQAEIDPELLKQVREKALSKLEVSLDDLIRATF